MLDQENTLLCSDFFIMFSLYVYYDLYDSNSKYIEHKVEEWARVILACSSKISPFSSIYVIPGNTGKRWGCVDIIKLHIPFIIP